MHVDIRAGDTLKGKVKSFVTKLLVKHGHVYPTDIQVYEEYDVRGTRIRASLSNVYEIWRWIEMEIGAKEPETLTWIDEHMSGRGVFVDVGACIGNYSIYAALRHPGLKVVAFEPEPNSFSELVKNIHLNSLDIQPFILPLTDKPEVNFLNTNPIYNKRAKDVVLGQSFFIAGESNHQFGRTVNADEKTFTPSHRIGMAGWPFDDLVSEGLVPAPNYLKIDVDGIEDKVIEGMSATIANPELRTVLCEISGNLDKARSIVQQMKKAGFTVTRMPENEFGNYIFVRN